MISRQVLKISIFKKFQHFGTRSQIRGFSRFWTKKYVGYAICIADTIHLGVGHTILDHTGSISYVLEMFSVIFGKFNGWTIFLSRFC